QEIPAGEQARDFDLPAGDLGVALDALGKQAGIELVLPPGGVEGRQARAVAGRMDWPEALRRLLGDTDLVFRRTGPAAAVIEAAEQGAASGRPSLPAGPDGNAPQADPAATDLAAVTVTGTRIRGGTSPSPVITIGSENIRAEGFTDLGQVIRALPQNFTGGQNPGVPSLGYSGAGLQNQNITGGSALNLRGLGPDATLTLLNGRRMAYGGMAQAVDIDAIPVEAVDRIEIVADGASAIYGSDAVGGVGNVILRQDFDGVAVGARVGTTADGGMTTREYTATAGTAWASGGLLATFKTASVEPIYARQRPYTRDITHPATLYPGSDLDSGLLSIGQSLGQRAEVRLDALRTERDQIYNQFSPDGRINRVNSETVTTMVAPVVEFLLPADSSLTVGGSRAKSTHLQYQHWEVVETGARTLSVHDCLCNEGSVYEVGAEGPVFALAGGDARMAAGAGYRTNDYLHYSYLAGSATTEGDESSRFAYAELHLPLVGNMQEPS